MNKYVRASKGLSKHEEPECPSKENLELGMPEKKTKDYKKIFSKKKGR